MATTETVSTLKQNRALFIAEAVSSLILFVGSSLLLLFLIGGNIWSILPQWSESCCQWMPPYGTWARGLNDFFEQAWVQWGLFCFIVGYCAILFTVRLVRNQHKVALLWYFARVNFAAFLLSYLLTMLLSRLGDALFAVLQMPNEKYSISYGEYAGLLLAGFLTFALTLLIYTRKFSLPKSVDKRPNGNAALSTI